MYTLKQAGRWHDEKSYYHLPQLLLDYQSPIQQIISTDGQATKNEWWGDFAGIET